MGTGHSAPRQAEGRVAEPMASTLSEVAAGERGRRLVMLDPNIRVGLVPDTEYRQRLKSAIAQSTIVKASEADLAWIYPGLDHELAAEQILGAGVSLVVVTLGARGAFGAHRTDRRHAEHPHVEDVATIGAGHAFSPAPPACLHIHHLVP